ncbi:hypothetical protein ACFQVA_21410 [Actinomadura keratinilytica]
MVAAALLLPGRVELQPDTLPALPEVAQEPGVPAACAGKELSYASMPRESVSAPSSSATVCVTRPG